MVENIGVVVIGVGVEVVGGIVVLGGVIGTGTPGDAVVPTGPRVLGTTTPTMRVLRHNTCWFRRNQRDFSYCFGRW